MLRKTLLTLLILFTLFAAGVSAAWAGKDYRAQNFDVQFALQPDGSALVTETVTFRFDGGPFTYVFRDIDTAHTDGITFIDASMDGERMRPGTQAGQVEVTGSAPVKVTWHFAPTSDAIHQFVVRYRVQGVVRKENADTIYWPVIPKEHDYAIDRSAITLTYPDSAQPIEPPTLDRPHETTPISNGYRLTTTDISSDDGVYLTARFVPGTAATIIPQWQIKQQQAEDVGARTFPIGLLVAVVTLLCGGLGLYLFARAHHRESIEAATTLVTTPPAEIEPALAARLTGHSQGYLGTLFALAQRGVLEVHEEKGRWNSKKYILDWKNAAASLSAHERGLLSLIFKTGETTVDMSAIPSRLMTKYKVCDEPLERELIDRGWFDPERKRQRTRLIALGFGLMLGGLGIFMLGAIGSGFAVASSDLRLAAPWAAIIGVGAGAFMLSMAWLVYGVSFSPLTVQGEAEAARWKSFAKYLKQVSENNNLMQRVTSLSAICRWLRRLVWAARGPGTSKPWAASRCPCGFRPCPAAMATLAVLSQ